MILFRNLQVGDIFATKGRGIIGWVSRNLSSPRTDRFHYGILWKPLEGGDFIILESLSSKGISVGKLSWYKGSDVKYYRVDCDEDLRLAAPDGLVEWGRAKYDYWLIPKLLVGAVIAWVRILCKEHRLRKLKADDLSSIYSWDSRLLCTEATWVAYNSQGVNIISYGIPPLPSAFREAELEGRIHRVIPIVSLSSPTRKY